MVSSGWSQDYDYFLKICYSSIIIIKEIFIVVNTCDMKLAILTLYLIFYI